LPAATLFWQEEFLMTHNQIGKYYSAIPGRAAWLLVGLLGLALLAAVGDNAGPSAGAEPKPDAAPTDLERVPRDAVFFATVRVADLWNSDAAKELRQMLTKEHPDVLQEIDQFLGVRPADIERLTVLIPDLEPRSHPFLVFLATTKPYDRSQVLKAAAPGAQEEKHKDHTLHYVEAHKAFCFLDNRTLVMGELESLRAFLDEPAAKKDGPLSAALQAAGRKHLVVAGMNPAPLAKVVMDAGDRFPPEFEPFKPLLAAKSALLTLDLGKEAKADLSIAFANADDAKKGMKAVQAGQTLARNGLAEGIKFLAMQPDSPKQFVEVLKQIEAGLETATVQQKDATVQAALSAKVDVAVLGPAFVQGVQKVRESANRITSQNNLKQLALAVHNYESTFTTLPPAAVYSKDGKPLLSWRVLLLPYLEQETLYNEFKLDEPWDSEHNKKLLDKMPKVFDAPGAKGLKPGMTVYRAFTGKGTVFEGVKGIRFTDITDGTSNTLLFVEAAEAVPWTKPDDLPFVPGKLPKLGGLFKGGFNAAMCDGSVRFFPATIKAKTLEALITRNGGEVIPDDN
jgi:prepilin-type processing-associated H-X9-DG protein